MKKIILEWKKFLEQKDKFPYQIYCDMDGVLVDFANPLLERLNRSLQSISSLSPKLQKLAKKAFEATNGRIELKHIHPDKEERNKDAINFMFLSIKGDIDFWADLPWAEDGKMLWDYIKDFNPLILTAGTDSASEEGKTIWVKRNLHLDSSRIFFSQTKEIYAIKDDKPTLLIDDFVVKINPFREAGGIGILHREGFAGETIKKLIDIKNKT